MVLSTPVCSLLGDAGGDPALCFHTNHLLCWYSRSNHVANTLFTKGCFWEINFDEACVLTALAGPFVLFTAMQPARLEFRAFVEREAKRVLRDVLFVLPYFNSPCHWAPLEARPANYYPGACSDPKLLRWPPG